MWKIPKEEILVVGDDLIADVEGARSAGFSALRVSRESTNANDCIQNITDLEDWLRRTVRKFA